MQASTLQRPHPARADTTHTPMHATRDRPTRAAHAVAPAVACFRPAPHSPAPKSMAHRCHAVTVTVWGLPNLPLSPLAQTLAIPPTPSLIGSPSRHRGSGETRVTVSCEVRPRLVGRPPAQDYMYPFGVIGVAPLYIPVGAVFELAGI